MAPPLKLESGNHLSKEANRVANDLTQKLNSIEGNIANNVARGIIQGELKRFKTQLTRNLDYFKGYTNPDIVRIQKCVVRYNSIAQRHEGEVINLDAAQQTGQGATHTLKSRVGNTDRIRITHLELADARQEVALLSTELSTIEGKIHHENQDIPALIQELDVFRQKAQGYIDTFNANIQPGHQNHSRNVELAGLRHQVTKIVSQCISLQKRLSTLRAPSISPKRLEARYKNEFLKPADWSVDSNSVEFSVRGLQGYRAIPSGMLAEIDKFAPGFGIRRLEGNPSVNMIRSFAVVKKQEVIGIISLLDGRTYGSVTAFLDSVEDAKLDSRIIINKRTLAEYLGMNESQISNAQVKGDTLQKVLCPGEAMSKLILMQMVDEESLRILNRLRVHGREIEYISILDGRVDSITIRKRVDWTYLGIDIDALCPHLSLSKFFEKYPQGILGGLTIKINNGHGSIDLDVANERAAFSDSKNRDKMILNKGIISDIIQTFPHLKDELLPFQNMRQKLLALPIEEDDMRNIRILVDDLTGDWLGELTQAYSGHTKLLENFQKLKRREDMIHSFIVSENQVRVINIKNEYIDDAFKEEIVAILEPNNTLAIEIRRLTLPQPEKVKVISIAKNSGIAGITKDGLSRRRGDHVINRD